MHVDARLRTAARSRTERRDAHIYPNVTASTHVDAVSRTRLLRAGVGASPMFPTPTIGTLAMNLLLVVMWIRWFGCDASSHPAFLYE